MSEQNSGTSSPQGAVGGWREAIAEVGGVVLFVVMLAMYAVGDVLPPRFFGIMGCLYGLLGCFGMAIMRREHNGARIALDAAIEARRHAEDSYRQTIDLIRTLPTNSRRNEP